MGFFLKKQIEKFDLFLQILDILPFKLLLSNVSSLIWKAENIPELAERLVSYLIEVHYLFFGEAEKKRKWGECLTFLYTKDMELKCNYLAKKEAAASATGFWQ